MTRIRIQRLEKELLKLISTVVNYKLRDKRLDLVTINHVTLSNDMSYARIYYSHMTEFPREEVQNALTKSSGFIKNEIAAARMMRTIPELNFIFDEFEEKARRIDEIFSKIESEKKHDPSAGQDEDPESEAT